MTTAIATPTIAGLKAAFDKAQAEYEKIDLAYNLYEAELEDKQRAAAARDAAEAAYLAALPVTESTECDRKRQAFLAADAALQQAWAAYFSHAIDCKALKQAQAARLKASREFKAVLKP